MKKLTTRDLFVSHIIRTIALKHIYIKLRVTENGTVISFGSEQSCYEGNFPDSIGSKLIFDEEYDESWEEPMDLGDLKEEFQIIYPKMVFTLSEDKKELLLEAKTAVPVPSEPINVEPLKDECDVIEYIYTHRRTILSVKTAEAVYQCNNFVGYMPFRPQYQTHAYIATEVYGMYTVSEFDCCDGIDELLVEVHSIESLDRSKFDVYCLHKSNEHIVYEITNKQL